MWANHSEFVTRDGRDKIKSASSLICDFDDVLCVRSMAYFKFLEGNSTPEDIPVGAPVSLEFL